MRTPDARLVRQQFRAIREDFVQLAIAEHSGNARNVIILGVFAARVAHDHRREKLFHRRIVVG